MLNAKDLILKKISTPIGVIGVIFEARPDCFIQISSLIIKSGNCAILKGGKECIKTNQIFEKLVKSAIANAENNFNMKADKLYVAEVYANQGTTMKRIRAATQGRANRIRKRTSHITVVLKERE